MPRDVFILVSLEFLEAHDSLFMVDVPCSEVLDQPVNVDNAFFIVQGSNVPGETILCMCPDVEVTLLRDLVDSVDDFSLAYTYPEARLS